MSDELNATPTSSTNQYISPQTPKYVSRAHFETNIIYRVRKYTGELVIDSTKISRVVTNSPPVITKTSPVADSAQSSADEPQVQADGHASKDEHIAFRHTGADIDEDKQLYEILEIINNDHSYFYNRTNEDMQIIYNNIMKGDIYIVKIICSNKINIYLGGYSLRFQLDNYKNNVYLSLQYVVFNRNHEFGAIILLFSFDKDSYYYKYEKRALISLEDTLPCHSNITNHNTCSRMNCYAYNEDKISFLQEDLYEIQRMIDIKPTRCISLMLVLQKHAFAIIMNRYERIFKQTAQTVIINENQQQGGPSKASAWIFISSIPNFCIDDAPRYSNGVSTSTIIPNHKSTQFLLQNQLTNSRLEHITTLSPPWHHEPHHISRHSFYDEPRNEPRHVTHTEFRHVSHDAPRRPRSPPRSPPRSHHKQSSNRSYESVAPGHWRDRKRNPVGHWRDREQRPQRSPARRERSPERSHEQKSRKPMHQQSYQREKNTRKGSWWMHRPSVERQTHHERKSYKSPHYSSKNRSPERKRPRYQSPTYSTTVQPTGQIVQYSTHPLPVMENLTSQPIQQLQQIHQPQAIHQTLPLSSPLAQPLAQPPAPRTMQPTMQRTMQLANDYNTYFEYLNKQYQDMCKLYSDIHNQ